MNNRALFPLILALGCAVPKTDKRSGDLAAAGQPADSISASEPSLDLSAAKAKAGFSATNGVVTVSSEARFAGAISSLTWKGKEFINSADHGRELQIAYQLDGRIECYNPTEAGSETDGSKQTTSSVLINHSSSGSVFSTLVAPAFWIPQGRDGVGYTCGGGVATGASPDRLAKTVHVGYNGLPHVIYFQISVALAEAVSQIKAQAPIAFLTADFSETLAFDPVRNVMATQTAASLDQNFPIIKTRPDHTFAMGIYAPRPVVPGRQMTFGYSNFNSPAKAPSTPTSSATRAVAVTFTDGNVPGGTLTYEAFVIVGDFKTVQSEMLQLARMRP